MVCGKPPDNWRHGIHGLVELVPVAIFPVEITVVTAKTPEPGTLRLRIVQFCVSQQPFDYLEDAGHNLARSIC